MNGMNLSTKILEVALPYFLNFSRLASLTHTIIHNINPEYIAPHYTDVTWGLWHLKLLTTLLFFKRLVQANIRENIEAFAGGFLQTEVDRMHSFFYLKNF